MPEDVTPPDEHPHEPEGVDVPPAVRQMISDIQNAAAGGAFLIAHGNVDPEAPPRQEPAEGRRPWRDASLPERASQLARAFEFIHGAGMNDEEEISRILMYLVQAEYR